MRWAAGVMLFGFCALSVAAFAQAGVESSLVTGASATANAKGASTLQKTLSNGTKNVLSRTGTTTHTPAAPVVHTTATPRNQTPTTSPAPAPPAAQPTTTSAASGSTGFSVSGATSVAPAVAATKTTKNGLTIVAGQTTRTGTLSH